MWTYEDLIPTLIPNTTMQKGFNANGVHKIYVITPNPGYVLHDAASDQPDEEAGTVTLAFASGSCSCGANYDFVANPREFYAIPEEDVPENSVIYGGVDNDHEVM